MIEFKKYIVTSHKTPTGYNDPKNYVVEAASGDDAIKIVQDATRDFGNSRTVWSVKDYTSPPAGRIIDSY